MVVPGLHLAETEAGRLARVVALRVATPASLGAKRVDADVQFAPPSRDLAFLLDRDLVREAREPVMELSPLRR
jgi:hypothetical protein